MADSQSLDDAKRQRQPEEPQAPAGSAASPGGWLSRYAPHVIIFFSSACIMVVELVAGRLIARHLGSSLYTWTSVIGVVLAGMSIGNYVGGRMADRWKPRSFLGYLFLLASGTCLLSLALNQALAGAVPFVTAFSWVGWELNWAARVFLAVTCIFMPPALLLGTISPAIAKLAVEGSSKVGTTLGSVYAWGAVGSIVGTFATGFWLIAALGTDGVVVATALCLAVIGLILGPGRGIQLFWAVLMAVLLLSLCFFSERLVDAAERMGWVNTRKYLFHTDSHYQNVRVYTGSSKDGDTRVLALDHLVHGYYVMDQPWRLLYAYEQVYADVAWRFAGKKGKVDAFFLGGGAYTFPRWVLYRWPGSRVEVAEIDPAVLEACHVALGLERDTPIVTHLADARNAIEDLPEDAKYDFIFGDAFSDLSPPWHLTTIEFNRKLAKHLKQPGGVLLQNIIESYDSGLFLGAYVETLKRTFKHVYVFCSVSEGVVSVRDTFVVAATDSEMDFRKWLPGHSTSFSGSLLTEENMEHLARRSGGRILTDNDAPVENLLEPVMRARR